MSDLVTLASQISTPIKVGWLLSLVWLVVQVGTYRWSRQAAAVTHTHTGDIDHRPRAQVSEPADDQAPAAVMAQAEAGASEPTPRRRRRRRTKPQGHEGAQGLEATA